MNIYVRRGGELLGPFSAEDVQTLIDKGSLSLTDDACFAGLNEEWKPLRDIVPNVRPAVARNYSSSENGAGLTDEIIHDSTDQIGDLQVAKAFTPTAKSRISGLASAGKLVRTWLLFNHAIARGYATSNPAENTAKAKVVDSPPGILTVQQTARLLEAASPELLPYVAIGAFAGLRRAELERLDWSDVHFDADLIEVTAQKSKTARRRFVRMQPNLCEWLVPARKHSGKVTPDNFPKRLDAARTAAGITEWPDNALRHSFASYHLAHFKDAAALALEMGHTDSGIIFNHYRQLVRPKDAERYWNIRPTTSEKIVPLVARSYAYGLKEKWAQLILLF
jgi:site-specific recombinase XerD